MQPEESTSYTVGFSDYTQYYEFLREAKEKANLSEKMVENKPLRNNDLHILEEKCLVQSSTTVRTDFGVSSQNNNGKTNLTTYTSNSTLDLKPKFSIGRGQSLQVMVEHVKTRQAKRSGRLPVLKTPNTVNAACSLEDNCFIVEEGSSESENSPKCFMTTENKDTVQHGNPTYQDAPISWLPAGMTLPYSSSSTQRSKAEFRFYKKERVPNGVLSRRQSPRSLFSETHGQQKILTSKVSQEKSLPVTAKINSRSLNLRNFSATLISALEATKRQRDTAGNTKQLTSLSSSNSLKIDLSHDDDMRELLELATASTFPLCFTKENAPPMLKLSKLAELIEEGRVLVRSEISHSPTHNLRDFPFDSFIFQALVSLGFEKPKIIQAYVWDAILRGHHVAYIAGARTGKTLGYLIPLLNNLLDQSEYSEVPIGCSPLAVIVCSSGENAEMVQNFCCRIMKKAANFRSAVFSDATERSLKIALPYLINGVTLLASTAPALSYLMEESKGAISFERCCHLIFDDADVLLQEHALATKKLFGLYDGSVRRMSNKKYFVPRQIVACANHWTKGMEVLSSKAMKNPSIFISSCLEASVYGGMKLDVRRGTPEEMDCQLLEIVQKKKYSRTIIFCRGSSEVFKVETMLSKIGIKPLLAHNQSIVSDLDFMTLRWKNSQPGSAILICTDDVLERLDIKDAQTLIHYFIPHHSKYDFSYRLSFAMDNFTLHSSEAEKPETHLLITKEFNNSLLTIVRFMQRFGHRVPDELATEAILSYCEKEIRKKHLPLCASLKALGFCKNLKFCGLRHLILENLDQPVVPANGRVRIRITAVRTATCYYARILKHVNEHNQLIDLSSSHLETSDQLRNHFRSEAGKKSLLDHVMIVEVGNVYARRSTEDTFERVRVESILERDHQGYALEIAAMCVDQGHVVHIFVKELYEIPESLKNAPPEAVEIYLVGVKPVNHNTTWSRYSVDFVREKLMNKELEGRIVLALSSTLWLKPLHERKCLDGLNSSVVVTDIKKELLTAQLAEKNEEHIVNLHHLCETGGIVLPNYNVGLSEKISSPANVAFAFLPLNEPVHVEVKNILSPHQFYVSIVKFKKILQSLEKDVKNNLPKCKFLTYEEAQVGTLCLAESPIEPGIWSRCYIKEKLFEKETWKFLLFFVDYGDYASVPLNGMRRLPQHFISRLPFQAIACTLNGVGPRNKGQGWSEDDVKFFASLTRTSDGYATQLALDVKSKGRSPDKVTSGPHYFVCLTYLAETEQNRNLAEIMVLREYGIRIDDEHIGAVSCNNSVALRNEESQKLLEASHKLPYLLEDEDDMKFDVSAEWVNFIFKRPEEQLTNVPRAAIAITNDASPANSSTVQEKHPSSSVVDSFASLALVDHTVPLKNDSSRFPSMKWRQTKEDVIVTFVIGCVEQYTLDISPNHINFMTNVNGIRYEVKSSTYGNIIPDKCHHSLVGCGIKATLRKQEPGVIWTRFILSPFKQHWLTRDFSCLSPDDGSDDEKNELEPLVDPRYAFEDHQSSSCSSESDDECADETWIRDDD